MQGHILNIGGDALSLSLSLSKTDSFENCNAVFVVD
jgi:hypothetical protein